METLDKKTFKYPEAKKKRKILLGRSKIYGCCVELGM